MTPFVEHVVGPARQALWALLGAVVVLLLIACVNVSGLMLTRASHARREHAIQLAMGASDRALARQWLVESAVLAALGGGAGLRAAPRRSPRRCSRSRPTASRGSPTPAINLPVALAALAATLVAAVVCGAGPMRLARGPQLLEALQDSSRATAGGAARCAAGGARSCCRWPWRSCCWWRPAWSPAASRRCAASIWASKPSQVLSLQIDPRLRADAGQRLDAHAHRPSLAARPTSRPSAPSTCVRCALGPIGQGTTVVLEGQPDTPETAAANPLLNYQVATPGYFGAMRIPLRAGRVFTDDDRDGSERVVVVGESTARRLWPGREAVGQRLLTASFDRRDGAPKKAWRRVVGVVADVRYRGLDEVSLDLYDPATQSTLPATDLVVRTSGDPLALASTRARRRHGVWRPR